MSMSWDGSFLDPPPPLVIGFTQVGSGRGPDRASVLQASSEQGKGGDAHE
jgi:hypothetical protein